MSPRADWNFPSQAPPTRSPPKWTAGWKQSSDGPNWEWPGLYREVEQRQCPGHWGHCRRPSPYDWSWPWIHPPRLKRRGSAKLKTGYKRERINLGCDVDFNSIGPSIPGAMVLTYAGWLALQWILRPWSPMRPKAALRLATRWTNSRFMPAWMTRQSLWLHLPEGEQEVGDCCQSLPDSRKQ